MAHHIDAYTNEGAGEDKELDNWLMKNDLMKIKSILQKENISFKELCELSQETQQELKEYGKNELDLDLISRKRFVKAVKSLSTNDNSSKPILSSQLTIVRIVLSKEEDEAMENLNNKKEEIKENIENTLNNLNILKQTAKVNENELNEIEQEFIKKIKERINSLKIKSNQQINEKNNILSAHIEQLTKYMKQLNDANIKVDNLLNDTKIEKKKRKNKIINISQNVLNVKININESNITPQVQIEINKNKVCDFISKIGNIQTFTFPDVPLISITDIKSNSATVIFKNKKPSYEYTIELCKNYVSKYDKDDHDEKKMNWTERIREISDENKYIIAELESGINYGVKSKYKNKYGFGKYSKISTFKTKKMEVNISSVILGINERIILLTLFKHNGKQIGKSWNLLYKRSRDGLHVNTFRSKCHNKNKLICLISTSTGNIFGGFTSTGWDNFNGAPKRDEKAFIFSVKSSANYKPIIFNVKNTCAGGALYSSHSNYCWFGDGNAFYINSNGNGYAGKQPSYYERYPHNYYLTNTSSNRFIVSEIEVFQMIN